MMFESKEIDEINEIKNIIIKEDEQIKKLNEEYEYLNNEFDDIIYFSNLLLDKTPRFSFDDKINLLSSKLSYDCINNFIKAIKSKQKYEKDFYSCKFLQEILKQIKNIDNLNDINLDFYDINFILKDYNFKETKLKNLNNNIIAKVKRFLYEFKKELISEVNLLKQMDKYFYRKCRIEQTNKYSNLLKTDRILKEYYDIISKIYEQYKLFTNINDIVILKLLDLDIEYEDAIVKLTKDKKFQSEEDADNYILNIIKENNEVYIELKKLFERIFPIKNT